jgi:hypothetical protein
MGMVILVLAMVSTNIQVIIMVVITAAKPMSIVTTTQALTTTTTTAATSTAPKITAMNTAVDIPSNMPIILNSKNTLLTRHRGMSIATIARQMGMNMNLMTMGSTRLLTTRSTDIQPAIITVTRMPTRV